MSILELLTQLPSYTTIMPVLEKEVNDSDNLKRIMKDGKIYRMYQEHPLTRTQG